MSEYTIINDQIVDLESGEMLGPVVEAGEIVNELALETVLDKIGQVEARLSGMKNRHELMKENMAKLEKRVEAYLEYLYVMYNQPVEAYASKRLEGAKTKTLNTAYGSVSFRTSKASVKVTDNDQAVLVAKSYSWDDAIKTTETFQVSKLTEEQKATLTQAVKENNFQGFEYVPESQKMAIKTVKG